MNIEIYKISSVDLPHHPAYVAGDLRQVARICEMIGTTNTVWSQDEIDVLGRGAAAGKFNMYTAGNRITISFKDADTPEQMSELEHNMVNGLRSRGFAVIVWTPEELKDADPDHVQDRSIEFGWDVIRDLQ